MNKQNYLIERESLCLIKRESSKEGTVKICFNNSDEHEIVKLIVAKRLLENGYKIYTECEFNKPFSGRPDIFAVKERHCLVYEILNKESDKDFMNKIKTYPNVTILRVRTKGFNKDNFKI